MGGERRMVMVGSLIDQAILTPFLGERYPVLNREPRIQIAGRTWHLIWERDGGQCWMCWRIVKKGSSEGQLDHIIPWSAFPLEDLWLASRSDNLRVACADCNQARSNRRTAWTPRTLGIVERCHGCMDTPIEGGSIPAYCAKCGLTSWAASALDFL